MYWYGGGVFTVKNCVGGYGIFCLGMYLYRIYLVWKSVTYGEFGDIWGYKVVWGLRPPTERVTAKIDILGMHFFERTRQRISHQTI